MSTLQIKTGSITSTGFENTFTDIHDSPKWDVYIKITADLKLIVTLKNTKGNDSTYYNGYVGVYLNGTKDSNLVVKKSWSFSKPGHELSLCKEDEIQLKDFPNNLYLYCSECTDSSYFYGDIRFTDARHSKTKPGPPEIVSSTGTTITVKPGKASSDCVSGTYEFKNVNAETWYNKQTTLGGSGVYGKGSPHTYQARQQCVCKIEYLYSSTVTGTTWDIEIGNTVSKTTKSLTFEVKQKAGSGGDASSKKIKYSLYDNNSYSGTAIKSGDCGTGSDNKTLKISGLSSDTKYYLKTWTDGITDNYDTKSATTNKKYTLNSLTCNGTSATTLKLTVNITPNESTAIESKITVKEAASGATVFTKTNNNVSSSYSIGVTGLAKGVKYNIYCSCTDADGNKADKSISATTKNLYYISSRSSTKNIEVELSATSDVSCFLIDPNGSTFSNSTPVNGKYYRFPNCTRNSLYTIYAELNKCYAYDADGNETGNNDSGIGPIYIHTQNLEAILVPKDTVSRLHSISVAYNTYTNESTTPTGKDSIDGSLYKCTSITVQPISNSNYRQDILSEDLSNIISVPSNLLPNDNASGYYTVTIDNLKYSYCLYKITATFSDGYNSVPIINNIATACPYVYIYSESDKKYHKALPYIYDGSKYRLAIAHVYNNGKYNETE